MDTRADLDIEDLLKIILGLVAVWLLIEIVAAFLDTVLGPFRPLASLLIVVIIGLYLLDRI